VTVLGFRYASPQALCCRPLRGLTIPAQKQSLICYTWRVNAVSDLTLLPMGGGQAIMIDPVNGTLMGASDPRKDGLAIGY